MNTNERLILMLERIKKPQKDICREMEWNKNKITDIRSGKSSISLDDFIKMFDLYQKDIGAKNFIDCFSSNLVLDSNINIGSGNQNVNGASSNTDEIKLIKYFRLLDEATQTIALGEIVKLAQPFIALEKNKLDNSNNVVNNLLGKVLTKEELDRMSNRNAKKSAQNEVDVDFKNDED